MPVDSRFVVSGSGMMSSLPLDRPLFWAAPESRDYLWPGSTETSNFRRASYTGVQRGPEDRRRAGLGDVQDFFENAVALADRKGHEVSAQAVAGRADGHAVFTAEDDDFLSCFPIGHGSPGGLARRWKMPTLSVTRTRRAGRFNGRSLFMAHNFSRYVEPYPSCSWLTHLGIN